MTEFSDKIDLHDARWEVSSDDCTAAREFIDAAMSQSYKCGTCQPVIWDICDALELLVDAVQRMIYPTTYEVPKATMIGHTFSHCWEYEYEEMPPAEVTFNAITDALYDNDPVQGRILIAEIDAWRTAIWESEFDEVFFSNMVRRFSIWG